MTDFTAFGIDENLPDLAPSQGRSLTSGAAKLSHRQKAAIIVRVLLSDGNTLSLGDLPQDLQVALTREIGSLRTIEHDTLCAVINEFVQELDGGTLNFSGGLQEALSILEGSISAETARRLSREEGVKLVSDPWKRLVEFEVGKLAKLIENESVEVTAVLLSKLSVEKSAEVLTMMPGEQARRAAYAVSRTEKVGPEVVRTIGRALLAELDAEPRKAFSAEPVARVGEILNSAVAATRDGILEGLESEDAEFAEEVRKRIFTFADIADRVDAREVPKIIREVDQATLVTALAFAGKSTEANANSAEFILTNMSKRMAESLREEMEQLGEVKSKAGEPAMDEVVAAIRRAATTGEITIKLPDADEE